MKGRFIMSSKELDIVDPTTADTVLGEIQAMASGAPVMYSSIVGDTFEGRKATYSAVANAERVRDNLGRTINLANVIVQAVDLVDENTGVVSTQPRTILIDNDGTAFYGISGGLFRATKDLIGMLGEPENWEEPVPVAVKEMQGKGANRYYTLELV